MKISLVKNKDQLNVLRGLSADFEDLHFEFSEEYLKKMKDLLDEKNAFQLIAEDEEHNFMGYLASAEKKIRPGFLWIAELFIKPGFQGCGVASALCGEVINHAKAMGLSGVITQTEFKNFPAQNLYEKSGFKKIDNPDWKGGITYILKFS